MEREACVCDRGFERSDFIIIGRILWGQNWNFDFVRI